MTPEAAFAESDAVFSATVAAIVEDGPILHVFVDLLEVWKGEFPIGQLVRVDTADNPAACGFAFQLGEEYVIFAYQVSGILNTDICTATGLFSRGEATEQYGAPLALNPLNVEFRRGDVNGDGDIDLSDPIGALFFLFADGFEPPCLESMDFQNDDQLDIGDAIASLTFQFFSGPAPADPFPECGKDPDFEPSDCSRHLVCPPRPDTHEIVRVEAVGAQVEIELFSTRPFPVRALFPILCVGTQAFPRSRLADGGSLNTLIFTLTREEFDSIEDTSLAMVQHGDQCLLNLDQMRLYWDLWIFGPLEMQPQKR